MLIRTDIILEANQAFRVAAGGALIAQFRITRQMFNACETGFSCSRQRHQTSSDLREPLSSNDQGIRTTPAGRCIKATQNFLRNICCKKVNFDFSANSLVIYFNRLCQIVMF